MVGCLLNTSPVPYCTRLSPYSPSFHHYSASSLVFQILQLFAAKLCNSLPSSVSCVYRGTPSDFILGLEQHRTDIFLIFSLGLASTCVKITVDQLFSK